MGNSDVDHPTSGSLPFSSFFEIIHVLTILLLSAGCGVAASLIGALVAAFGKSNADDLRVGNASGIGFLIGASIGALIGIFQSMIAVFESATD